MFTWAADNLNDAIDIARLHNEIRKWDNRSNIWNDFLYLNKGHSDDNKYKK